MLFEILGTEVSQGSDASGSEDYILSCRDGNGVLFDLDGVNDVVTWTVEEGDGTDLTANATPQSRLSTGKYKVTVSWGAGAPAGVTKPFYWVVKASFTAMGASLEQEFVSNFLPVAESDLVLVDGADNYSKGWRASLADMHAALRGQTDGTATDQVHLHADDATEAFTVHVSADGDRSYT